MLKFPRLLVLFLFAIQARADLFLSGFSDNSIYRYDQGGALMGGGAFIAAGSGGLSAPHRSFYGADGNLYVASANTDSVLRYNGSTGAFIDVFIQNGANGLPANALDYPVDMALGPDGALYVSSQLNDSVLRFNPATGAFLGTFVTGASAGLDGPSGISFHDGDLFVVGRFSNAVYRYDGTTGAPVGTGVFATGLSQPFGITFSPGGTALVADGNTNSVLKFDGVSGASLGAFVSSGSGGLNFPIGVEYLQGILYVASFNDNRVIEFDGSSGIFQGNYVTSVTGVQGPNFMTFAVPEPGVFIALISGAALLLSRRHRR